MEWFRMYHGVLHDPKVHRLTIVRRWRWVEILCIASAAKERGRLPSLDDLAFHMRIKRQEAESVIADLIRVGLVDESQDGKELRVHDWDEHQRPSDDTARRVRDWRAQQKQPSGNGPVTLQETLPLRNSNVLDSERDKTKKRLTSSPSSGGASQASTRTRDPTPAGSPKRRSANPTPAPPEVIANDPTFARIAAEDERVRRAQRRETKDDL